MGKVVLICGKISSGKTTYARAWMREHPAVLLSMDEITTIFFGPYGGDKHYVVLDKTRTYLLDKSLEVLEAGADVVLDWGFWTKAERQQIALFYEERGVRVLWHYVDAEDGLCLRNLRKRNREIEAGERTDSYYLPEEVVGRFWGEMFEVPRREEMDVWYVNAGE